MRCYFNGVTGGFTVSYTEDDADNFSYSWPGSSVEGRGFFAFAPGGDLIDAGGSALEGDGHDWLAFAEDCKNYGMPRFEKRCQKEKRIERSTMRPLKS